MINKNVTPHHRSLRLAWVLSMLLTGLLLSACTDFTVQNTTSSKAYVLVKLPGTFGKRINLIDPNSTYSLLSLYGGGFEIKVLPDQEYLTMLEAAKTIAKQMLEAVRSNPDAPVEQWKTYWDQWLQVIQRIQEIEMTGASCSGNVEFFGTVSAVLSKGGKAGYADPWTVSCSVQNPVAEDSGD